MIRKDQLTHYDHAATALDKALATLANINVTRLSSEDIQELNACKAKLSRLHAKLFDCAYGRFLHDRMEH